LAAADAHHVTRLVDNKLTSGNIMLVIFNYKPKRKTDIVSLSTISSDYSPDGASHGGILLTFYYLFIYSYILFYFIMEYILIR